MSNRSRSHESPWACGFGLTLFLMLLTAEPAGAQAAFFFSPAEPSTRQVAAFVDTVDVCGTSAYLNGDFTVKLNGQQVGGQYRTDPLPCQNDLRLIVNLTAVPGDNVLEANLDDAGGLHTDFAHYYYGAWITPRSTTSTIRAMGSPAAFEFGVRNTTTSQRSYSFLAHCPDMPVKQCQPVGTGLTLAAGDSGSVFVQATTGAAQTSGSLSLKAFSSFMLMDSTAVLLTNITPMMVVSPHTSTTSAPPSIAKVVSFEVSHPPGTVSVSYRPYCPAAWFCSIQGAPTSIGASPDTVDLQFIPQAGSPQTLYLAVYETGAIANRDSGGVTVTVTSNNTVSFSPSSANVSKPQQVPTTHPFSLQSSSQTSQTFNLSVTQCANMTGCSVNTPVSAALGSNGSVTASFTPGAAPTQGTMVIRAEQVGNPTNFATATLTVTPTGTISNYLVTDFSINNYDNVRSDLCEASCFAVRTALSTVPYIALDQPRSVTLSYNSDAVAVRPIVHADVRVLPGSPAIQEYWREAKDSTGAFITFVNGDTKLRFSTPQLPHDTTARLSGQFDASTYPTGVYPITLLVTAKFVTAPAETKSFSTKFLVVNERKSYVAKGWTIAGLSRLKVHGTDALIVDGTGTAVYFVGCGSGCYTSPGGDFTRLSSSTATGSLVFKREFPDSSRAEYDNLGFLKRVISRTLVDTTSFVYDGLGRLTQLTDPFRKNGTTALYIRISYLTQGIEYIEEPGQVSSQTGGRRTLITVNATDSTLRKWEEPGGLGISTKLRYSAAGLLERLINPRDDTTRFVYTAITMKADTIISPHFLKYPALSAADSARLRTHVKAWQVASVPLTTTATAPFSPGRVNTIVGLIKESGGQVTTFTPDRWGQPLVTTELPAPHPLQRKTTITRDPVNGLALSILSHTGALDQFTYHSSTGLPATVHLAGQNLTIIDYGPFAQIQAIWGAGQPMRTFVLGPRGRVDQAKVLAATTYTTQYAYDTRYRVTSTTDPGGHLTTFTYDPVYGNLNTSTAPGARTTTTVFDGYGRDSTLVAMTLPKRTLLYDPLNRVTQEILAASGPIGQATTVYSYADKVNLTSVTDAENNVYQYVFNALGAVTQHTDPYGTPEKSLYDAQGRLSAWVSRIAGDTVFRTYDDLHRPRETRVKRDTTVMRRDSLSYAASGLWIAGENFVSRDTIYLDATGWTTSIATRLASNWAQRILRTYTQDANSRLDSVHVTYPGSIAATGRKYVWDGTTGALTAARVNGVGPALGFNSELLPSSMTMPGGVTATLGSISIHDPYRQKYNTTALDGSFWRSLNYDQLGRVDIQYGMNGVNLGQRSFIYDARSRLRSVHDSTFLTGGSLCEGLVDENNGGTLCQTAPTPVFNARDSVAYSAVGNISYLNTPTVTGTPVYSRNRLKDWPRQGGTFSYVVDTAGFRTRVNKGTTPWTFYRWTPDGLLDTVRVGAGSNVVRRIKYDYNAFGELVRRSIDGTVDRHFLWDRGNLLAELNGALTARRSE